MLEVLFENLHWNMKIKVFRVIYGWNQTEAADKCSTHQRVFWNWEKGKNYPTIESQIAIAKAFRLKREDIFSANDKVANV